ncbi:hypothetical protein M0R88_10285 [Halorussus gelatinilyticus]|uniref:DUF8054 domain-containing protein n=1 Tax=Halorussus gelatinilyticus TaxID=2937524 RepID=A0A8U0IFT7_9EURY|nr:hypothetical protein [Halorussus gelatinilyticus]UPV98918.1 hypothetical protein M0R88_10285 [Halorussus gelatinilyticus]
MTSDSSLDSDRSGRLDLPDLPDGTLVRSRVESDPTAPLSAALDRRLTGYAVLEPQDALLLDAEGAGVVAFEDGVPRFAYHTGTDRGGPAALADLAVPGPYDVALRESEAILADLAALDRSDLRVSPGQVADRLAGDPDLAERTREVAPPTRDDDGDAGDGADDDSAGASGASPSAVEAFLDDEAKIDAIREQAREEARERAEEWGLDGELE